MRIYYRYVDYVDDLVDFFYELLEQVKMKKRLGYATLDYYKKRFNCWTEFKFLLEILETHLN